MVQKRTNRGNMIDMDALMLKNEEEIALGNMKVNARGDKLGPGGKIVRKREDVLRDYYEDNVPATEFETPVQPAKEEVDEAPAVQVEEVKKSSSIKTKAGKTKAETAEEDWVEDKDGNFVKRGA